MSGLEARPVLAVNCGSSTLKLDVVHATADERPGTPLATGARALVEGVGRPRGHLHLDAGDRSDGAEAVDVAVPDHATAARLVLERLGADGLLDAVTAAGHRVVHGGGRFVEPVVVDAAVERALADLEGLAPLHNRAAIEALRGTRDVLGPDRPMIAVFDTAFHAGMPARAASYAINADLATRHGIRRFGFHGLAHRWMAERFAVRTGADPSSLRLVTLQLGAGCSATAVDGGRSVDTTMGLTPLEGLMMATRSGDVDPSLVGFLARREGVGVDQVEAWLNHDSGLLGVSGASADLRVLLELEAEGHAAAALAVDLFCYRIRKAVGALDAALGGTDGLVFGGGIGEHSAEVRRRVCAGLERRGIVLDDPSNRAAVGVEATVSASGSPVRVEVLPVDEASVIARDVAALLVSR